MHQVSRFCQISNGLSHSLQQGLLDLPLVLPPGVVEVVGVHHAHNMPELVSPSATVVVPVESVSQHSRTAQQDNISPCTAPEQPLRRRQAAHMVATLLAVQGCAKRLQAVIDWWQ
jgi:hypothetical protein